ncbi:MAG: 23S rRNA (adenine(2503)-C(2))-methyltransferase RlmN [Planctomycetaceae bacterium]
MTTDITLHDLSFDQLSDTLVAAGVSRSHGSALFKVLHDELDVTPEKRDELSPPLLRWLNSGDAPPITLPEVVEEIASEDGFTRKLLLRLADGHEVESVLMGFKGRFTACLSTQVGCAMGCVFCATGQMGFRRHLTVGEVVTQAYHVEREVRRLHGERLRNLVMMGMGEPLHNFEATAAALEILTDRRGLGIGATRVTISTVGHVAGIQKLADYPQSFQLAVSLHGTTDEEREALVPVNKKWPLAEVLSACRDYSRKKRQRVLIAWTLIGGVNDDPEQAQRLADLLEGMSVHVNLIPLNPTDDFDGSAPEPERVDAFQQVLKNAGIPSTVRQRRGIDVAAGCGQLRSKG